MQKGVSISGNTIVTIAVPATDLFRFQSTPLGSKNIAPASTAHRPRMPSIALPKKKWAQCPPNGTAGGDFKPPPRQQTKSLRPSARQVPVEANPPQSRCETAPSKRLPLQRHHQGHDPRGCPDRAWWFLANFAVLVQVDTLPDGIGSLGAPPMA